MYLPVFLHYHLTWGILMRSEFIVVLQIMSWQPRFSRDQGKAPAYDSSQGDLSSSDDDTISTGEQAIRILQSHFDCGGDDIAPTGTYCVLY